MDLETYLAKEVNFREYPEDFEECIRSTFGEDVFSKYKKSNERFINSIDFKREFYEFFSDSGLFNFFLQIDEFKAKNCMDYISAQLPKQGKILDAGIGDATKLAWYALNNPAVKFTGVDFCESFLKSAREKLEKRAIRNCSLTYGNISNLPFSERSFDLVIADHSLHEFQTEYGGADESFVITIPEVMRVLKPGGKLVGALTMPHYGVEDIMYYFNSFIQDSGGKDLVFEERIEKPEYSSIVLFSAVKTWISDVFNILNHS